MPFVTAADRAAGAVELGPDARATALGQVRAALMLIATDPYARGLLSTTGTAPSTTPGLTDWLYAHWWCGPGLRADAEPAPGDPAAPARGAARLETARRTVATRSSGWLVLAALGGLLVAARVAPGTDDGPAAHPDRRIRTTTDAVVASSRPGLPPRPGDLVTLRLGGAGLDPTGSWWWAYSSRPEVDTDAPLDRWYVHARDLTAATALVPLLLAAALEAGCEVSLKCPPTEAGYGRRDALVVYLPRASAAAAEAALQRYADTIDPLVEPDVPPLTRPLLPGVARAEDPGPGAPHLPEAADAGPAPRGDTTEKAGISYGQLRCSQVAAVAARLVATGPDLVQVDDATLTAELALVGVDVDAAERMSW
jgi:hypothetical protein